MNKIAAALVKAQREFGPALKSSSNPHFRSRYADLSACVEAVIDGLNNNGIFLTQPIHLCEDGVVVETIFLHESGEQLSAGKMHVPATKQDAQGYGSALTYARRYSLMAACGIAPEDDDGNAASKPKKPEPKPEPKVEKPPAQIEGKDEPWQIKVTTDGEDTGAFVDIVFDATNKLLELAKNEKQVMDIFKVNRAIFDKIKSLDASLYNELMDSFKTTKAKFQ